MGHIRCCTLRYQSSGTKPRQAQFAAVLALSHGTTHSPGAPVTGWALIGAGPVVGFGIGIVAALIGVAGANC